MIFKRLEIVGFKSFGDKTILEFEPGITAVVGPNGCGKSNVSDAIRWVLGEQSAKALRGGRMEDVIFNGTDDRSPINMAEVSFTLEDPEKKLSIGFHEVTVTRRVFRDGQGEYFINKAPCRLRDIHELFMGTGIGTDAYSILEQGKMDMILNAKPQERREIFEEAAGITKFKSKKNEALRKLDSTDENLVRVNDIIKEVRRQIQSVTRYAAKARQYRALFDEAKSCEVAWGRHRFSEANSTHAQIETELSQWMQIQEESSSSAEKSGAQLVTLREHLQTLVREHDALRGEVAALENEIHRRDTQSKMDQERLDDLNKAMARWQAEMREHQDKIEKFSKELDAGQAECEELTRVVAATRQDVLTRDADLRSRQEKIRELTQQQKQRQELLLEEELGATRARNEMGGLSTSHRAAAVKRERLLAERNTLASKAVALEEVFANANSALSGQQKKTQLLRESSAALEKLCADLLAKIETAREGGDKLREELAQKMAQAHLIKFGKYSEANRVVLEKKQQDPSAWTGLLGTLGDLMRVEPGYEAAVEAALGYAFGDIIIEGEQWVAKMREVVSGEITILSAEHSGASAHVASFGKDERVLGEIGKFIRAERPALPIIQMLVSGTYVARSWEDAIALARSSEEKVTFVTLRGESVSSTGRVICGALGAEHGARESVILAADIEQLKETLHDVLVEKGGVVVALDEQKKKSHSLEQEWRHEEIRLATLQNELDKLVGGREEMRKDRATVEMELEEVAREEERFTSEQGKYQRTLDDFSQNQAIAKNVLASLESQLAELSGTREKLLEAVTHAKIALASQEEKLDSRLAQRQNLSERLKELLALTASKESDSGDAVVRIAQLEEAIALWKNERDGQAEAMAQKQGALSERQADRQRLSVQSEEFEKMVTTARSAYAQTLERQRTLEVQRAQLEAQRDHLRENLWKEFQVDLRTPEEPSQEPAFSLEAFGGTWEAVQQRVAEIRKSLEGMGSVNVAALQEHDELQSRYDFLVKQHAELLAAKDTLLKVIARINTTTRKLFTETFALIRTNFQEIFVQLFGGGKADLLLSEEGDILEAGIEIIAKPPGKQLRTVSLLSGGEKALTAIALLFAVFHVKPSPFCVLDEIDAPLDESNITRFVEMLKEYAKRTQFIVITHNKRTISKSDLLYGITMQESGLSKVVSVRLSESAEVSTSADAPKLASRLESRGSATPLFERPSASAVPVAGLEEGRES